MARPIPAVDPLTKAVFPTSFKSMAVTPSAYRFIFLKKRLGMLRTSNMITAQNQGT